MPDPIYCPFCGTKHALIPECSGRHQQVVCGSCGARGPEVYRWLPYATAVESWNMRQEPTDTNTTHRASGVAPSQGQSVNADLLNACKAAARWLEGWVSAKPYLSQLHAAIERAESAAGAVSPSPQRDVCTDPDNCKRCAAPTWDQVNHHHAGIPVGPQQTPAGVSMLDHQAIAGEVLSTNKTEDKT